jgi:hypothetical protein
MQHRLALLAARIAVVPADARSDAANLRQLRTALNVLDVRRVSVGVSRHTRAAIEAFLAHLASICRNHMVDPLPHGLVGQLDDTIAFTLQDSSGEARDEVLVSLAGIRSGLFPESPPYQPQKVEPRTIAA